MDEVAIDQTLASTNTHQPDADTRPADFALLV